MTFGNIISALLGVWFIYLGASKGTSFYWSGYIGAAPPDRRGPTIPQWIGMPFFICVGVGLLYYSIRHILR
jgi:hypothetical protein